MRRRTLAIAGIAALATAGAAGAWAFAGGSDWAGVVSIERDARYQDPGRLERAWALPAARTYRERFTSQPNGSVCGPTSIIDVLRSLGSDADQESVLAGTDVTTLFGYLPGGITLDQLAAIARARMPERRVTVHRDLDLAGFRALIARANDPGVRVVANFHRGPLFARGGGHHSPIAGWLEDEDLVFVLDVNDDYGPWLAPSARVHGAIDTVDPVSGLRRGILVIE
jgi:hypothetical protein